MLLVCALGCSAPAGAKNDVQAVYDNKTGRLTRLTYDSNKNGKTDSIGYMDGTSVLRVEVDRDEDVRPGPRVREQLPARRGALARIAVAEQQQREARQLVGRTFPVLLQVVPQRQQQLRRRGALERAVGGEAHEREHGRLVHRTEVRTVDQRPRTDVARCAGLYRRAHEGVAGGRAGVDRRRRRRAGNPLPAPT